jgi:hypothetical protein
VPPGKGLVSGYCMHEWSAPRMELGDDELLPLLLDGMEPFVPGISSLSSSPTSTAGDP